MSRNVKIIGLLAFASMAGSAHAQTGTRTEVFFSQVYSYNRTEAMNNPNSIDRKMAAFIDGAKKTLDAALFEIHNHNIVNALIRAHQRGVKVRLVSDLQYRQLTKTKSHQCPHYPTIEAAGIPIVYDNKTGLMHNKFLVRDRYCVWTGSVNSVDTEVWQNHNNAIKICSTKLAANYLAEFDEMFVDKKFGPDSPAKTPYPTVNVGRMKVETCFAPEDNCGRQIVNKLLAAKSRILVMAFSVTDFIPRGTEKLAQRKLMPTIRTAILGKKAAGLDVRAVLEHTKVNAPGSLAPEMIAAGIPVRADSNPGILHSKVFIIDGRVTVIGSFNFSGEAENGNDENMVIVTSPTVARQYEREFLRIWDKGKTPAAKVTCDPTRPVNINTGLVQALSNLPGMGWRGAGLIKANRPYATLDDLVTKRVMTAAKLATIRQCLTVTAVPQTSAPAAP